MLPFAFGSQTAASLIRPASYCGIPGYKATHGAFDLQGVMALSPSLDTLGFLAREIEILNLPVQYFVVPMLKRKLISIRYHSTFPYFAGHIGRKVVWKCVMRVNVELIN